MHVLSNRSAYYVTENKLTWFLRKPLEKLAHITFLISYLVHLSSASLQHTISDCQDTNFCTGYVQSLNCSRASATVSTPSRRYQVAESITRYIVVTSKIMPVSTVSFLLSLRETYLHNWSSTKDSITDMKIHHIYNESRINRLNEFTSHSTEEAAAQ